MKFLSNLLIKAGLVVEGSTDLSAAAAIVDTDKFVVLDGNTIKYRTGSQVLSDIGGQAAGSYVTTARTLTINGTAFDLSADRSWSVGTVTSIAALTLGTSGTDLSSSVANGTTTPVITLQVPTASASNRGALSSADWTTFNNKQAAGNYITALTGEVTASGPGSVAATLLNSAVIGKLLTGLNLAGGGTISATDSILIAFGKTQNQISALVGGVNYDGVWNATTNTPAIVSGVGSKGDYYVVNVAGSTNIDGITDWKVGDWIIFNGTVWDKVDNTDAVSSVNGFTGAVSLTTANISEVTNLYYTEARVDANTNVAANTAARHNAVTIGSANGLSLSTQVLSLGLASTSANGALSSTDWNTFNAKQNTITLTTSGDNGSSTFVSSTLNIPTYTLSGLGGQPALNGTGFVKISGTTISYDNSTYYLASNPSAYIALTSLSAGAGISYNNTTGVITSTITQYTDTLARAAISETVTGLDYNNTTGVLSLTSGYVIPTTSSATNWDAAYNDKINSAAVTGTTTKTLTLTQQDGGTITANWTDDNTDAVTSVFGRTGAVIATSGDYTTTLVTEGTNLYYTDTRARAALSFVAGSGAYNSTTGVITIPTNNNQITNGAGYTTNVGTVTSVNMSVPTGLSVSGNPITTSGTLAIALAAGYVIPTQTTLDGFVTLATTQTITAQKTFTDRVQISNSGSTAALEVLQSSGSGIGLNISKGGNGEALYVNKTSGTGNAATIIGTLNATTLVKNGGTSSEFLKADGTVDSTSYGTGSVTSVAALTLGTTGTDLSSTVANGTTTAVITLQVPTASATNRGALSSADFTTFNAKEPAITAGTSLQYYRGDKTFQTLNTLAVPELTNLYFTEDRVRTSVLTGLNLASGGTIAAADNVLQAFGKVQNQISALVGGVMYDGLWNASTNTPTLVSSVGTKGDYYVVSVAGSTNIDGITDWKIGDWIIFNGTTWDKVDNTDAVSSVNGYTGTVSLVTGDVLEGAGSLPSRPSQLYFTDTRARAALSAGTGISYNSTTGVITNSAPDQTVSITAGSGISVSGTYPSFTVASTITQYTDALARAAISLTVSGGSGASTYNNSTGVLNVPTYTLSGLGGVPTTRTLTINGTALDLSADRTFNVGTVTSVGLSSATSGVTIGATPVTTSGTITLAIATASGSQNGLLSSTDWTTFNNKQSTITLTTTGTSGAATFTSNTLNIPNYAPDLSGYVTLATTQTISGAKTFSADSTFNSAIQIGASSYIYGSVANGFRVLNNANTVSLLTITNAGAATFSSTGCFGGGSNGGATFAINNGGAEAKQTFAGFSSNLNLTQSYNNSGAVYVVDEYRAASYSFKIGTTLALTIASTGAATFSSSVQAGGLLTVNVPTDNTTVGIFHAGGGTANRGLKISTFASVNDNAGVRLDAQTSTGVLAFATVGVDRLTIASTGAATFSGNVGINGGTTSFPLSVKVATNQNVRISSETSTSIQAVNDAASAYVALKVDGLSLLLNTQSGGNVLIGTTTDAGFKLDVNGTGRFTGALSVATTTGYLNVGTTTVSGFATYIKAGASGLLLSAGTTSSDNALLIQNQAETVTLLTIKGTGAATFSNSITSNYTYNGGGVGMLHLTSNGTEGGSITFEKTSGTAQKYKFGNSGTALFVYNETGANQPFTILNNGNVLIGTTTDVAGKLQVNGEIRMTGSTLFRGMSSNTLQLCGGTSSSNVKIDGSVEVITMDTNGATRLTIASTGAATFSSTITTAAPSGSTAKPFKVGAVSAVSHVYNQNILKVEIDGIVYQLMIADLLP